MAKRPYAFEGKWFKPSRLKALLNLSLSRAAILMNKRQPRCSLARSDIVHLLSLGLYQPALLRVERVIEEQNMLDALAMIQSYCRVVIERVKIIKEHKECPDELEEAISSLIFASKRTGEFPELRVMREVFTTLFGKDFVDSAVGLHSGCGVDIKMIEKLCKKQPSLETREKVLQEIAAEKCIDLTSLTLRIPEKNDQHKKNLQEDQQAPYHTNVEPFSLFTTKHGGDDAAQEDLQPTAESSDFRPSNRLQMREWPKARDVLYQRDSNLLVRVRESDVEQAEGVSHTKVASQNEKINSVTQLSPCLEDTSTSSQDSDSYNLLGSSLVTKTPVKGLADYRKRAVSVRTRR